MTLKRLNIFILVVVAFLGGYYFGVNKVNLDWKNYSPKVSVQSKEPPMGTTNVNFSQFWTVWNKLENGYYDKTKIDGQKMLNGAIAGMVESLEDPFTVYLPPVQNDRFKQGLAGQFSGIGAELGMKDKNIIVIAPLSGSPAEKAGVKAGDVILKVNNEATLGWTTAKAVEKIRGEKGTEVSLSLGRKDISKPIDVKIVRDVITIKSVEGWIKPVTDIDTIDNEFKKGKQGDVAYVRLSQFGDSTNKDWVALINDITMKIGSNKNFKGIILDLRNNPGGYLNDAVFISSEFLDVGRTVVIEDNGIDKKELKVTRRGLLNDQKVVILINKGSASASEIVAGALRDNEKVTLIGETSFGKGTIQQAEDLGEGAGLHVTVAKWLTPNETWVNGKGLTPDVSAELDEKQPERDLQLEKAITELLK